MSRIALIISIVIIFGVHFLYSPKWQKSGTEATISWDVSGYYFYLPAAFIYKDMKELKWRDHIFEKYKPQPGFSQAFKHEASGNYVMKYSIGQAVVYSPFFFIAHAWALNSSQYPVDGFSFPYQFMISMGMLLWTIIGLIYMRKSLLLYFSESVTALGILGIVLGSNYLNYVAIDGAMTHNTVFTIYAVLIYLSIRFHKNPTWGKALGIGACVGLASLIRPTEIISCLLPILWGVNLYNKEDLLERIEAFKKQWLKLLAAVLVTAMIGFIQLAYWNYASGDWLVYSYEDQGFSWLRPHLFNGILSYRTGWLVYSPLMVFSLIGFINLFRKNKGIFYPTFIFAMSFIYIAFAWDIWWYGGSLGQRTMVQAYPILLFPFCGFIEWTLASRSKWIKIGIGAITVLFIYANLWFTHQAHLGGILKISRMQKQYFWKTLFTYEINRNDVKLLDIVDELFEGERNNVCTIYHDPAFDKTLDQENQFSGKIKVPHSEFVEPYDWVRVSANVYTVQKEWTHWKMTQFSVDYKDQDKTIKNQMFRIQNLIDNDQKSRVYLDLRKSEQAFTDLEILFWNSGSDNPIQITDLKVELFEE